MTILTTGLKNERFKGKEGFTLLELLLVMIIVAVAMGIAAPGLGLFTASRHIFNTSARFVALADYARTQSVSEGRTYRLNIDREKGAYWLTAEDEGGFGRLATDMGKDFLLPEGVRIESVEFTSEVEEVSVPGLRIPGRQYEEITGEDGQEYVSFSPEGYAMPALLRLSDKRGNVLEIVCRYPSDRFHVEEPGD